MTPYQEPERINPARSMLLMLGAALIVAGAFLLFYVGMLVWQTINHPGEIPLVAYIMERIKTGEEAISGSMTNSQNPGQEVKFDMKWAESMRLSVYLVVGAVVFSAFARVGGILVSSGAALIRTAFPEARKNGGKS